MKSFDGRPVTFAPGPEWHTGTLVGFDTETTGVDTASDHIVSAALIVDSPDSEPKIQEWLIKVADIPLGATAIHGISTEHSQKFGSDPDLAIIEMVDALSAVAAPLVVVNGTFDFSLVVNEAARYGIDAKPVVDKLRIVDTMVMDKLLDPYRPGRRTLTSVSASYGVAIRGAHQASGDVLCAIRLARAMGKKYPGFGHADLEDLQEIQANAYWQQAKGLRDFRRMDDPTFNLNFDWPYHTE